MNAYNGQVTIICIFTSGHMNLLYGHVAKCDIDVTIIFKNVEKNVEM